MSFDWSLTKRKLTILIPNYDRQRFVNITSRMIKTNVPEDQWCILVVNDGISQDFSDISASMSNFYNITIRRKNTKPRNGCFARNFAIKRIQSEWIFQRDPEVIVSGDFINNVIECGYDYYRVGNHLNLNGKQTKRVFQNQELDISNIKTVLLKKVVKNSSKRINKITTDAHYFLHWGFALKTHFFQKIKGYDEDYVCFGKEDKDMFYRLKNSDCKCFLDYKCCSMHMYHTNEPHRYSNTIRMNKVFKHKNRKQLIRNPNEWGNG